MCLSIAVDKFCFLLYNFGKRTRRGYVEIDNRKASDKADTSFGKKGTPSASAGSDNRRNRAFGRNAIW